MTPEQYAASQAVITTELAAFVRRVAGLFLGPVLTPLQWLGFLQTIFPEVQRSYVESAALGRRFYDSQRSVFHPELPRNETYLGDIRFDWFVKNMEPARKGLSQGDSPKSAVSKVVLSAVREVEMGARRQVIKAVESDTEVQEKVDLVQAELVRKPEPSVDPLEEMAKRIEKEFRDLAARKGAEKRPEGRSEPLSESRPVLGWARVATGRETCAWCLMLISRGAEVRDREVKWYLEAATAGLMVDDETALDAWRESGGDLEKFREMTEEYADEWHAGCDCVVVPVFDANDWPGRAGAVEAQKLWIDASLEAAALIESGDSRTKSKYTETLNALRRRLYRGEISMSDYAIAA